MKKLRNLQNIFFLVFCFVTLLLQTYFASQAYSGLTFDTVKSQEIFILDTNTDLKASSTNTRDTVFQFSGKILEVRTDRNQNDSSKAIFEVSHSVAIPLRQDLTLSFSILARQLNLNSDAGRLYIVLSNGTNTISLNYVVGYREPDWKQGTFSYVFYQLGNDMNTWFESERNMWNDLIDKNFTLESWWNVISITFGCISYWKEPSVDSKMDVFFNASKTSLYYENSTFTKVIPITRISWPAVYEMLASMLLFLIVSVILIRTQKQHKPNALRGF